jgi:hypothetical protein
MTEHSKKKQISVDLHFKERTEEELYMSFYKIILTYLLPQSIQNFASLLEKLL